MITPTRRCEPERGAAGSRHDPTAYRRSLRPLVDRPEQPPLVQASWSGPRGNWNADSEVCTSVYFSEGANERCKRETPRSRGYEALSWWR